MIAWISAQTEKPSINKEDNFDKEHQISKRVLVWFIPINGVDREPIVGFGRFYRELEDWVMEDFRGDAKVLWWSDITDPGPVASSTGTIHMKDRDAESLASIILDKD